MQDDKGSVVDLGERRREKRAGGPHPIHAEIHDLIDQILDRAEIYEKAGRRAEAERLLAGLKHARDEIRNPPAPAKYGKKAEEKDTP